MPDSDPTLRLDVPVSRPPVRAGDRLVKAAHHHMKGRILAGRYRVVNLLSRGGMGTIYLARDVDTGLRYAVKTLRPDVTTMTRVRERFMLEARAQARVDHPAVARVVDVGETADGTLFLVMEYVEGPTLRRYIDRGPMAPGQTATIIAACAEGLAAAHAHNVIHRDLKPENILLPRGKSDSPVKIVDFGIARLTDFPTITTTRHVLGTPSYMSPEQAMGAPVDPRTDVYSLGVIWYELLSGELPFSGRTPQELVDAHLRAAPSPLHGHPACPSVSPDLSDFVLQCLHKDPLLRPASMEAVLDALPQITP